MRLRLFVSSFASCGVSLVTAQPNPDSKAGPPAEALPPIFAPRASPKSAKPQAGSRPALSTLPARRAISPEMAANLSAIATRAAPPPNATPLTDAPVPSPPTDASDAVQLRPYVVQEDRLPEFKERDMLTPKGKLDLARRRFPGVVGPLNDAVALRMLEEDFAKERRRELADLQGLLEISGPKPSKEVQRKINEAGLRPSGFSPEIGAPFRPPK